jgi:hypothetical protein
LSLFFSLGQLLGGVVAPFLFGYVLVDKDVTGIIILYLIGKGVNLSFHDDAYEWGGCLFYERECARVESRGNIETLNYFL